VFTFNTVNSNVGSFGSTAAIYQERRCVATSISPIMISVSATSGHMDPR
jgi:hypothetical protein